MARIINQLNADLAEPIYTKKIFNAIVKIEFCAAAAAEAFRRRPARAINRRHSIDPVPHAPSPSRSPSPEPFGQRAQKSPSQESSGQSSPQPSCSHWPIRSPKPVPSRRNRRARSFDLPRRYFAPEELRVAINNISRDLGYFS